MNQDELKAILKEADAVQAKMASARVALFGLEESIRQSHSTHDDLYDIVLAVRNAYRRAVDVSDLLSDVVANLSKLPVEEEWL